jgi:hypothetical protein
MSSYAQTTGMEDRVEAICEGPRKDMGSS